MARRQEDDRTPTIVIIGGGFSGTALAIQLLQTPAPQPPHIVLVERAASFGRGVAYATRCPEHLLNVPAARMSLYPDNPHHFVDWACQRDPHVTPETFVSRMVYGDYLEHALAQAAQAAGQRLRRVRGEATAVRRSGCRATLLVCLRDGTTLPADHLVLALGNAAPADPCPGYQDLTQSTRYVGDPWAGSAPRPSPDQPVLIVGAGLTMVDKVLELGENGQQGTIHALSRHGLLPHIHGVAGPAAGHLATPPTTVLELLRAIRRAVRWAEAQGEDWRGVLDALRPATQQTWATLSLEERRRFLRHMRPYWEIHRHRMAPQVGARIHELRRAGRLRIHAGRLRAIRDRPDGLDAEYLPRGATITQTLRVGQVINCTGPRRAVDAGDQPLIASLRAAGLIRPDRLGLGLDVDAQGALLDARGVPSTTLFALGSLCMGRLWETTAVPELRCQAAALGQRLLASTACPPRALTTAAASHA